ncbi:MAG: hypothetical protein JEY97_03130 [Bacteroidales bacterium]|nr:hypothetical protein [Bacteroidales bacterium]
MKRLIILFFAIQIITTSMAQVAINYDGSQPDASAMLEIKSTDAGMLVPRLSMAQRDQINNGTFATGLLIYQTDHTPGFYYYNGSEWQILIGADNIMWTMDENSLYRAVGSDTLVTISETGAVGIGNSNPKMPLDIFGYSGTLINGLIARFDSDKTDYSRIAVDGTNGADAQLSFMNSGTSKWTLGNDVSSNNSFIIRKGFGAFGTNDVFIITQNGQADLNVPLLGNQGGLTVGKKDAEAGGQTFSIVRSIGAHSIDTRYVTGFWAQSFGAYNTSTKLGNIGLAGSHKNVVDFMSFGVGGDDWWDMHSLFSVDKYGNAGIGMFAAHKSPTAKLEIDGSSTYDLLKVNTVESLTAFIVESSGNVGIGTDTPSVKLEVNGGIKLGNPDSNDDGLMDNDNKITVPEGTMRWNEPILKLQVFNGSSWVNLH